MILINLRERERERMYLSVSVIATTIKFSFTPTLSLSLSFYSLSLSSLLTPTLSLSLLPISLFTTANPTVIMSTKVLTVLYNENPSVPDNSHLVLVSGAPTPTFTWTLNGNNLNSSNNLGILLLKDNREVLFTRLFTYEHAGVYAVTAINEAGNATDSFILNVHGKREGGRGRGREETGACPQFCLY